VRRGKRGVNVKRHYFEASSPFEVGDTVCKSYGEEIIEDIACTHYAASGNAEFTYKLVGVTGYRKLKYKTIRENGTWNGEPVWEVESNDEYYGRTRGED